MSWKTVFVYDDDGQVLLQPLENQPFVQKASRAFEVHILPRQGIESFKLTYELLARDFNKSGEPEIQVKPEYDEKSEVRYLSSEPIPADVILIEKKLV